MKPVTIQTVSYIGTGNVATHLAGGLGKAGLKTDSVWSPHKQSRDIFSRLIQGTAVDRLTNISLYSDLYLIAVPDDQINKVVAAMPEVKGIVVHTSGITPLKAISTRFVNSGVFYPLQTFSKEKEISLTNVPFCLEGNNKEVLESIENLANKISRKVYHVDSEGRAILHLAAVFVSNFVNHLYHTAATILEENNLPFDLLTPLIEEVALKVQHLSPKEAQTGPARRNDLNTIEKHQSMLADFPEYQELYQLITRQIRKHHHE